MVKKVLFVCQRPPFPPNKGEKLRTFYQIRSLLAKGFDVFVACPVHNEEDKKDIATLESMHNVSSFYAPTRNANLQKALAFLRGMSISESVFFDPLLKSAIDEFIEIEHVDAVVATASSLVGYLEGLKVPTYIDFMDMDSDKWWQYAKDANPIMRWVYKREAIKIEVLERRAGEICKACYFISDKECELYKSRINSSANNIFKVQNGISDEEFYPPYEARRLDIANDIKLVFVGVMDYKPNEDAVVWFCENVWPALLVEQPNASFKIVGMSPSKDVQALASLHGVTVTDKVDSVLPFFHEADVFVAPFRLARGVQNKVLQAFACGLPVITTPMGIEGIEGNVEDCALLPETPSEFLEAINRLSNDGHARLNMGKSGAQLIDSRYSWDAVLDNYLEDL